MLVQRSGVVGRYFYNYRPERPVAQSYQGACLVNV